MPTSIKIVFWSFVGFAAVTTSVYVVWWGISRYRLWRTRPRPLRARQASLWRDPGRVESLDFRAGPGGPGGEPAPPFHFIEEHATGSNPCMSVRDAKGRTWRVKWGDEVRSETFATRLVWAAGFHVEAAYFVPEGRIEGASELGRASTCVTDCAFRDARFELDEKGVRKLFDEHGWSWDDNPFVGTRELAGLKIMLMLTSNWDNKDLRDVARGSNTAVFEHRLAEGVFEARYLIIDWGASMGRWGAPLLRSKWDAEGYEEQTPEFVAGVSAEGVVEWGYIGQRTDDAREGIKVGDARWLHGYLGRVTDDQLREGLRASGATEEEVERFTRAIRARIEKLGAVDSKQ